MNKRRYLILLCLGSMPTQVMPAEPLRHDPFARPAFAQANAGGSAAMVVGKSDESINWAPQISILMNAGRDSMAVVNGAIVRLGASIDGYRLVQITHGEAIFMKNGKRMAVQMKPLAVSKIDKESKQ